MNTISPRQPAAISAASTGLAVRLLSLCALVIASGLFPSKAATIYQTNLLSQTGQPLNTEITFERWDPTPARPFPLVSNRIRNGVLFVPSIASGQYTVSHNVGTRALTYKIIVPPGSVTNTLTELAEMVADYVISAGGSGSGSMTTVKANGSQVGGADIVTLDFAAPFSISESPDTEINIDLANGGISLNKLAQSGATTGQVVKWDGSVWAPANESGGGGGIADGDTLSTGLTFPLAGLRIRDMDASHRLTISPGSNLTADRTLTFTTGDANRTINIAAADVTVSAFATTLLDDADAATARATIGAGTSSFDGAFASLTGKPTTLSGYGITDAQPLDPTLTALAGLTIAANTLTIGTGADAFSQTTFADNTFPARASTGSLAAKPITDFGLSLVDDADAATARTTLGAAATSHTHAAGDITSGQIALARGGTGTDTSGFGTGLFGLISGTFTDIDTFSEWISAVGVTGTPDGTKFLRDDGSFQAIPGGGGGAFSDAGDPVVLNTTTKDVAIGAAQINSAKLSVDGDTDQVQLAVQGHSTQTANLVEIEDSGGTVLFSVSSTGEVSAGSGSGTINVGATGVRITSDNDGAITFLGLGNGSDEDLTINLDDTANTIVLSSSTGANIIDMSAFELRAATQSPGDNDTSVATTAFVQTAVAGGISGSEDSTDDTAFTLWSTTIATGTSFAARATVIGAGETSSSRISYELDAHGYRDSGSPALYKATPSDQWIRTNYTASTLQTNIWFDLSGNDLRLRAQGLSATDFHWEATGSFFSTTNAPAAANNFPDQTALVAYWKMEETGTANRVDDPGTSDLATTDGESISSGTGIIGNGVDLEDSTTQSLNVADNDSISLASDSAFTVIAWVKAEASWASQTYRPIIAKSTASANSTDYALYWHNNAFKLDVANGSSTYTAITSGTINTTGVWYMVVGRRDASNDTIYVSINGVDNQGSTGSTATQNGTGALYVGRFASTATYHFDGVIDSVAVWKRYLSDSELTTWYNSGAPDEKP